MNTKYNSSWNTDRVAAACNEPKKVARKQRERKLYAAYKYNVVEVRGLRGKCHLKLEFAVEIESAVVRDGSLLVILRDGSEYAHDVGTGRLLSERHPPRPSGTGAFHLAA